MKLLCFCLSLLFLLSGNGFSQTQKSAVGIFVSSEGGNRQGVVCLRIKGKTPCFEWGSTNITKFRGFANGKAWQQGAQWHITYYYDKASDVMILKSAAFKGRIVK